MKKKETPRDASLKEQIERLKKATEQMNASLGQTASSLQSIKHTVSGPGSGGGAISSSTPPYTLSGGSGYTTVTMGPITYGTGATPMTASNARVQAIKDNPLDWDTVMAQAMADYEVGRYDSARFLLDYAKELRSMDLYREKRFNEIRREMEE